MKLIKKGDYTMKNINDFVAEIREVHTLEELESGADLFQFGVDRGDYTIKEVNLFNYIYWNKKNHLLARQLYKENRTNYLRLFDIIKYAPAIIKDDIKQLKQYIYSRNNGFKGKVA